MTDFREMLRKDQDPEGRTYIVLVTRADWSLPLGAQAIKFFARSIPFDYAGGAGSPQGGSPARCSAPVCAGFRGTAYQLAEVMAASASPAGCAKAVSWHGRLRQLHDRIADLLYRGGQL